MRPPSSPDPAGRRQPASLPLAGSRLFRWAGLLLVTSFLLSPAKARGEQASALKDDFSPLVKLAPFVVNGQSLAISIYARSASDRRYGEKFAEGVAKVIYEAVTESTGKGLVIIGAKGEPHPIFVFRKFLALAKDGKLDPAVAARGPELAKMMDRWEHALDEDKSDHRSKDGKVPTAENGAKEHKSGKDGNGDAMDLDFDKIVTALPLPLDGIGAKLYQLAWEEKFDEPKVEAKLSALRPGDLERRDLFKRFDWVFYLPPKGAFDKVLDDLIADALKEEDVGFLGRVAVKGALLVVKPKIRRAIEAMRQGMMFLTVVQARTPYSEPEVSALMGAYIGVFMPGEKSTGGSDHERAVQAVRDQRRKFEESVNHAVPPSPAPVESAKSDSAP